MALTQVITGTSILAVELNAIVDMLQGASGSTDAFFFRSSGGNDFIIRLSDAAGARKFIVQDSAGATVASIDSDGALVAVLSPTTLNFPTSAAPAQTTDGQVIWDSDDNVIAVGDGAATKQFGYLGTTLPVLSGVQTAGTGVEVSRVDHSHGTVLKYTTATQTRTADVALVDVIAAGSPATMSVTVAANEVWRIEYDIPITVTGTGGARFQITGPSAPTAVSIRGSYPSIVDTSAERAMLWDTAVTAFASDIVAHNASAATTQNLYNTSANGGNVRIVAYVANGANAGTVTLQVGQNSANGTAVIGIGATLRAEKMA
jgi:hypothetical protein